MQESITLPTIPILSGLTSRKGGADDSRHWAAGMHVGALVLALLTSWISGLAGALVAGIVYLARRDEDPFVAARDAFGERVVIADYERFVQDPAQLPFADAQRSRRLGDARDL